MLKTAPWLAAAAALVATTSCTRDPTSTADAGATTTETGPGTGDGPGGTAGTGPVDPPTAATVVHRWPLATLAPNEEILPCLQWTLHNEEPVYVQTVTLSNDGGFHHSNWFVIPEDTFPGEDGYFTCATRGFTELEAAVQGTVLYAQSTQSRLEKQELPAGVVIKVPPRHKVVAGGHLLNLSNQEFTTELRMALDIIHPRDVDVVAAPFRLTYFDLNIRAGRESRFTSHCDMRTAYEQGSGRPLDLKVYYVLPHFHGLGNYFDLSVLGGPMDGQSVFRFDGFNADANGAAMEPAIDLTGAEGLSFTCGYNNWTNADVGWGIGDQEMCVMLGLADSGAIMDASVSASQIVGEEDGILMNEGNCGIFGLPKGAAQTPPTQAEIDGPLYVPPSDPNDQGLDPVRACEDTPAEATNIGPATLSSIRDTLFSSSCAFSSCHGIGGGAGGFNVTTPNLHDELLNHDVLANTSMPLVEPGDPEGSWLMHLLSRCEPTDDNGTVRAHMPLNAPFLAPPELVAKVRDWIEGGALDD